jgi:hypothetical protein
LAAVWPKAHFSSAPVEAHDNPVHDGGDVMLIRRDGSGILCHDYWYETSDCISFLMAGDMKGQRFGRIALDELEMKQTVKVNWQRGIEFRGLPHGFHD